jgi:2-polyprenyl-3-methyl-5-hydroxy-6-metoxy-1,4-benzoquinol methylase
MTTIPVYGWTDGGAFNDSYIVPLVSRIVKDLKPRTVLDAGCGTGTLAGALALQGMEVTGVDTDAGIVHLNDSGPENGADEQVSLETFTAAWQTSGNEMVVTT